MIFHPLNVLPLVDNVYMYVTSTYLQCKYYLWSVTPLTIFFTTIFFFIFFQGFRSSRQDAANNDNVPLDIGTIAAAGERCVDKVVMVQETEYDGMD